MWTPSGSNGLADIGFLCRRESERNNVESKHRGTGGEVEEFQLASIHQQQQAEDRGRAKEDAAGASPSVDLVFVCSQVTDNIAGHLASVADIGAHDQVRKVLRCLELGHHRQGPSHLDASKDGRKRERDESHISTEIDRTRPVIKLRSICASVVTKLLQRALEATSAAAHNTTMVTSLPNPRNAAAAGTSATTSTSCSRHGPIALELIGLWMLHHLGGAEDDEDEHDDQDVDDILVVPDELIALVVPSHELQPLLYTLREAADATRTAAERCEKDAATPLSGASCNDLRKVSKLLRRVEGLARARCIRRL